MLTVSPAQSPHPSSPPTIHNPYTPRSPNQKHRTSNNQPTAHIHKVISPDMVDRNSQSSAETLAMMELVYHLCALVAE